MEKIHRELLFKFEHLKGEVLIGKKRIKGMEKGETLPADEFVSGPHILHDLIRGFYKPKGKPYLLSYQATELSENYGRQIEWEITGEAFSDINMLPPSKEKDNRKKSDIAAARFNLNNGIPIGILYRQAKGENKILGLGLITEEKQNGVFIVKPVEGKDVL
ncbi:hypothetical protein [Planococcus beijingensis]|uniref:hypothetical protein n=1 Tax=Planococcus beijingensis TaxID=2782551 RepID=UPI00193C69B7|nr:hypothetical protein [Planococcus beijingensis]